MAHEYLRNGPLSDMHIYTLMRDFDETSKHSPMLDHTLDLETLTQASHDIPKELTIINVVKNKIKEFDGCRLMCYYTAHCVMDELVRVWNCSPEKYDFEDLSPISVKEQCVLENMVKNNSITLIDFNISQVKQSLSITNKLKRFDNI